MGRKRLNHIAHTACDIFCGWRLINSHEALGRLGTGQLVIDLLSESCTFDGAEIPSLNIAREIGSWMKNECQTNSLALDEFDEALLTADLSLATIPQNDRVVRTYFNPHTKGTYAQVRIQCETQISFRGQVYSASRDHVDEWPVTSAS